MIPPALCEYLKANEPAHLERLCELLRFPSVANDTSRPDPCARCAEWLTGRMREIGLTAEVVRPAAGGKPLVLAEGRAAAADAPTLLIYAHYDVQPPDPLDEWRTEPFEPVVRDGNVYARGACDDKGPLAAAMAAIEAWGACGGLPANVRFLVEGEEEIGSPHIEAVLAELRDRLTADAAVVVDTSFYAHDLPSITYGLRGLAYFEIELRGAAQDVHSGLHGGALANPANALARLIAAMHDEHGRVAIDGFYDRVRPVGEAERTLWARLPFDEAEYAASLGAKELAGGEQGLGVFERLWARPALDCNGIVSGYTEPGSKTIIPARASAKISCRLVPDQDPERIAEGVRGFVARNTPRGMTATVQVNALARPCAIPLDSPALQAGCEALREAFGRDPALVRCGASIPVGECIQRVLGVDAVLLGCTLPDDGHHAPNEKYALSMLRGTSLAIASLLQRMAGRER